MDSMRPHFSTGVRLFALVLGMMALLVLVEQRWVSRLVAPQAPAVEVLLDGQHYRVSPDTANEVASLSLRHLDVGTESAQQQTAALIERELDRVFAELSARLPAYADWHYSLGGEYMRLSLVVLGPLGLVSDDVLARKAGELIFGGDESFHERLEVTRRILDGELVDHLDAVRTGWLTEAIALLERDGKREDAPVALPPIALDEMLAAAGGVHGEFVARLSVSTAAGIGAAAAPLVARVVSRPVAAAGGRAVAARSAARGLAKFGGSAGSALGCAATGPGALPCAVLVGGATWGAMDWLLLSADEWLHREALIAEWQARLDELRVELEAALLNRYRLGLDEWQGAMRMELERSFSPLQSMRR